MKPPLIERIRSLPAEEREALRRRALDPYSAIRTPPFQLVTDKGKYAYIQKRNKAGSRESFNGPSEILAALAQLDGGQPLPVADREMRVCGSWQKDSAPHHPEGTAIQAIEFLSDIDEIRSDAEVCPRRAENMETAAELPPSPLRARRSWSSVVVWGSVVAFSLALGTYRHHGPEAKASASATATRQISTLEARQLRVLWQKLEAQSSTAVPEMAMAYLADDRRHHLDLVFYAMLRFSGGKLSIPNFQRAEHGIEVVGDFAGWLAALDQHAWMRPAVFRDRWCTTSTSTGLGELFKTSLRSVTFENGHLTMRGPGLGTAVREILSEAGHEVPADWHVEYAQDEVEIFQKHP